MNIRVKYFLIGALFGMCFPLGATIFELSHRSLSFSLENLRLIHQDNPILFMIDSAPLFLGLFALFGGISKERSVKLITRLRDIAEILSQNTEALQQQTDESLTKFLAAFNILNEDYNSIESLNRSTYHEISSSIDGTTEVSIEVKDMRKSLAELSIHHKSVKSSNQELKGCFSGYLEKMNQLSHFFEYLKDFSKQIEILAVNSAIEANRYGAEGKAFLVFSQNIHLLAQETKKRNKHIINLVDDIAAETNRLDKIIESEQVSLNTMNLLAENVAHATSHFSTVISGFIDRLHEASTHLDTQNSLTSRFSETLNGISEANRNLVNKLRSVVEKQAIITHQMNKA